MSGRWRTYGRDLKKERGQTIRETVEIKFRRFNFGSNRNRCGTETGVTLSYFFVIFIRTYLTLLTDWWSDGACLLFCFASWLSWLVTSSCWSFLLVVVLLLLLLMLEFVACLLLLITNKMLRWLALIIKWLILSISGKNVTLSILLFVVGWLVLLVSFGKWRKNCATF